MKITKLGSDDTKNMVIPSLAPTAGRRKTTKTFPRGIMKIRPVGDPAKHPPFKKSRKHTIRLMTDSGASRHKKTIKQKIAKMSDEKVKQAVINSGLSKGNAPTGLLRAMLEGGMMAGFVQCVLLMTAIWGPLGWMTLHSLSVAYPEAPDSNDKSQLNMFMDAFGNSITCLDCRSHFATTFGKYKLNVPSWNATRYDLFLAICRIHNSVNKRLDKPAPRTVLECLDSLRNATSQTDQLQFREKYFEHVIRNWVGIQYISVGVMSLQSARRMKSLHESYWKNLMTSYIGLSFPEADIFDFVIDGAPQRPQAPNRGGLSIVNGRLVIRKRK